MQDTLSLQLLPVSAASELLLLLLLLSGVVVGTHRAILDFEVIPGLARIGHEQQETYERREDPESGKHSRPKLASISTPSTREPCHWVLVKVENLYPDPDRLLPALKPGGFTLPVVIWVWHVGKGKACLQTYTCKNSTAPKKSVEHIGPRSF